MTLEVQWRRDGRFHAAETREERGRDAHAEVEEQVWSFDAAEFHADGRFSVAVHIAVRAAGFGVAESAHRDRYVEQCGNAEARRLADSERRGMFWVVRRWVGVEVQERVARIEQVHELVRSTVFVAVRPFAFTDEKAVHVFRDEAYVRADGWRVGMDEVNGPGSRRKLAHEAVDSEDTGTLVTVDAAEDGDGRSRFQTFLGDDVLHR